MWDIKWIDKPVLFYIVRVLSELSGIKFWEEV